MIHLTTDQDENERPQDGLVISLREDDGGVSRLILDDVARESGNDECRWKHRVLYAWKDFDTNLVERMQLSDNDYRDIGVAVMARLLAANGRMSG